MGLINYIKRIWGYGEEVHPDDLNKLENGIKSACDGVDFLVNSTYGHTVGDVMSFYSGEGANNAPMGLRKGMLADGYPDFPDMQEWVLYETYYYDSEKQYGWQRATSMANYAIYFRYKRNGNWFDWVRISTEKNIDTTPISQHGRIIDSKITKNGNLASVFLSFTSDAQVGWNEIIVHNLPYVLGAYCPCRIMNIANAQQHKCAIVNDTLLFHDEGSLPAGTYAMNITYQTN